MKITSPCSVGLLILVSAIATAQPVFVSPSDPCPAPPITAVVDWAEAGFAPCHLGLNPYEFVLSPTTVPNLELRWTYTTGDAITSSAAVANGMVYVGSFDGTVYALDARNGTLAWSYQTGGAIWSSPEVVNGVVYIGSTDDKVYALNAKSGVLLWTYSTGFYVYASPAVVNGVVYIGSGDKNKRWHSFANSSTLSKLLQESARAVVVQIRGDLELRLFGQSGWVFYIQVAAPMRLPDAGRLQRETHGVSNEV